MQLPAPITRHRPQPAPTSSPLPSAVQLLRSRLLSPAALGGLTAKAAGVPQRLWNDGLVVPVLEILRRPGKGFRGRLTHTAFKLAGGAGEPPPALAAIFEVIHAGSMIVDDIEDDSSERRGGPAVHRICGVPLALNAGNWMYFAPYRLMNELGLPAAQELRLCRRLGEVLLEAHFGQALDLSARLSAIPPGRLAEVTATISVLKTGRLLALAAEAGAICAGAEASICAALSELGETLGVGLQMLDDLGNLSAEAPSAKRHEDLRQGRVTWPWAWAAAELDEVGFADLVRHGEQLASITRSPGPDRFAPLAAKLRALVVGPGRWAAHQQLESGLHRVRARLGATASGPLEDLAREMARLEDSYG